MDCVTCDKCRVWGKLQILGIGTAIKILLHPAADKIVTPTATISKNDANLAHTASCDVLGTKRSRRIALNRQEIIALLNTLNNFGNSLLFAANAAEQAQRKDLPQQDVSFASVGGGAVVVDASDAPTNESATRSQESVAQAPWKLWLFVAVGYLAPLLLLVAVCARARSKKSSAEYR